MGTESSKAETPWTSIILITIWLVSLGTLFLVAHVSGKLNRGEITVQCK